MSVPRGPIRFSFTAKVLAAVLGFLVLLPAVTLWLVDRHISRQLQDESRQTLATAEAVFLNSLEIRSRSLLSRFRNVVNEPRFKAAAQLADRQTMAAQLRELLDELGQDTELILYSTATGGLLAGQRQNTDIATDAFERAARAISRGALGGDAGSGIISLRGRSFNVAAVPVQVSDRGPPVGVLTIGTRIGDSAVQELKSLTGTEIFLVADGGVTASTLRQPDLPQQVLTQIPAAGAPGPGPRIEPVELNHEHFLALSGSLAQGDSTPGLRYILLSSLEPRLRALAQTRSTLEIVSVAGILLSGLMVWLLIRRITQPLLELRASAEAVGRGDFSRRIERFSNDECGEVAQAFNRMTENLHSSRAELETTFQRLKATQAQLIQSEKLSAVGQFVAGVAHELNNPLATLIGFSELLQQMSLDEKSRKYADLIAKSAMRCHKIVHSLLGFARQHEPERKRVKLDQLVDAVVEILAYDLRTSNVEVRKDYHPDLPFLLGDAHQLQQVILNIVNNARQAIEPFRPDGCIMFVTGTNGQRVWLRIKDNGPGIPRTNLNRIFDPFFTTKPQGKGTGLGLSLSYGIVQEHGGKISVTSEVGEGAEFLLDFPIAPQAAAVTVSAQPWPVEATRTSGAGQSVLVIDDEEWILSLTEELLSREGYAVETTTDGRSAAERLARKPYDIIISDWKMPGWNGMQIFEDLLERDPATARRMLFMTGDVINDTFKAFLVKHDLACLSKPFSMRDLQTAVATIANGRRVPSRSSPPIA